MEQLDEGGGGGEGLAGTVLGGGAAQPLAGGDGGEKTVLHRQGHLIEK